jgi:hypothetical protein
MKKLSAVPVPVDGLTVKRIGTETIILTESGEELHTLDETGTFVWSGINGKRTVGQILDILCAEYDVIRERAQKDVLVFIEALAEKKIIRLT